MVRGVLLDIDGTLLESNEAHAHAWADAFGSFGWEVPFFRLKWLIGMGGNKVLQTIVPAMTDAEGIGKVIATKRRHVFLERYAPRLQPTPGARRLVQHIQKQGLETVVATSAKQDELEALLKAANVADLLHRATTSSDVSASKPSPDIVEAALHKLGLSPDAAMMIGDTPYDVEAAQRAGVPIIALRHSGWADYELEGAVQIYDDPADLLAHYDQSPLANRS